MSPEYLNYFLLKKDYEKFNKNEIKSDIFSLGLVFIRIFKKLYYL